MMKKTTLYSVGGLFGAAVLLVVLNVLFDISLKGVKWDLTDGGLYTLSDGTRNVLKGLKEPVTLEFYFSEKLLAAAPGAMNYGRRVRELLGEYESLADGKVKLTVVDPDPFSEEEDQAVQRGLQGVPVDNAGSLAYFGLAASNAKGTTDIIPFFQADKEESLEYDLTRMVYKLNNPKQRVVGVLSGLPMEGDGIPGMGGQEWFVLSQLRQLFEVRALPVVSDAIPSDVDVLLVVHPKNLADNTLFAIDQYVLAGGRMLAFVDPMAESEVPQRDADNPMQARRSSSLGKLFDAWGIEFVQDGVVGDRQRAMRVSVNDAGRPRNVEYVAWLSLGQDDLNRTDFVTADMKNITVGSSGYLSKKADAGIEFTPLIQTTADATVLDQALLLMMRNPELLLRDYHAGGKQLALAARIRGKVKTAFGDRPANETFLRESKDSINVILVADTDMLTDRFWVDVQRFFGQVVAVPRANNGAFVINAVENLSGSNDLISLRSRGKSVRPFDKVQELRHAAELRFREKETALQAKLAETDAKLRELQKQKEGGNAAVLSPEQRAEVERFRDEQVRTRKELRNVQHDLNGDIESLGARLKFINVAAVPLILVLIAVVMGVYRVRRAGKARH